MAQQSYLPLAPSALGGKILNLAPTRRQSTAKQCYLDLISPVVCDKTMLPRIHTPIFYEDV